MADGPKKGGKKSAMDVKEVPRFGRVRSNLKMGILGLPNVGELLDMTTFDAFNCICRQEFIVQSSY